jgi:hypothetical protein
VPIRNRSSILAITWLLTTILAGTASAACVGSTCSLGGQLRAQAGDGLPIPISPNPAPDGDLRWGQPGLVVVTPGATIMQQSPPASGTPGTAPRSLMLAPGALTYDAGLVSKGVVKSNINVLAVRTNLAVVQPHPGTTTMGAAATGSAFGSFTLREDGTTGRPIIVTWCAGLPGPTLVANPACSAPDYFFYDSSCFLNPSFCEPLTNGLVRYVATRNQFSGQAQSRVSGTVQIFFNAGGLALGDLPCVWGTTLNTAVSPKVNPDCVVGLSVKEIAETAGERQTYMGHNEWMIRRSSPPQSTANGVYTAHIDQNGTIVGYKTGALQTVTTGGTAMLPMPFAGQATTSWVLPFTTGRVTLSVTQNAGAPTQSEIFVRSGGDQRTDDGEGIITLVSGAVSARSISGPNADRRWLTLNVPEPSALIAFSAGFFGLLGCHALAKRRDR